MFGRLLRLAALTGTISLALAGAAAAQAVCGLSSGTGTALGGNSLACGESALAVGGSTSVGAFAGGGADFDNERNVAVGNTAGFDVDGNENTAIGATAGQNVEGNDNTASGWAAGNDVFGDNNAAMGAETGNVVNGSQNTATGAHAGSDVDGNSNVAAGYASGVGVDGDNNTATGAFAGRFVEGSGNIAIGNVAGSGTSGTSLSMNDSIAIGTSSSAGQDNSIAIGAGVATTRAGQVAIGDGDATYTLAGIGSDDSLAAQDPTSIRFVTSDLGGNLALSAFDLSSLATSDSVAALDSRVTSLEGTIGENRDEARGGTALALAAAGLRYDDRPEKLSIAGGVGHFKGFTGLSFGVGYATSDTFRINAAISGVPELGDVGVSAGVSWTLN